MPTASYDYARIIAAFGIVIFHAGSSGSAIGYAALPFFLMLIIYFGWEAAMYRGFSKYIGGRSERLLFPWLVWSAVFGTLKLVEVAITDASLMDEFALYMLFTGPAMHLWFLPFAFVVCLILWPLTRLAALPVGMIAFVAALALQAYSQHKDGLPVPLAQWAYVAPAVSLGFCLAVVSNGATIICVFTIFSYMFGWTTGLFQITLAGLSLVACQWIVCPQTPLSKKLAHASMGVYLIHPLVLSMFQRILPIDNSNLFVAILAAMVSLCMAFMLTHLKVLLSLRIAK